MIRVVLMMGLVGLMACRSAGSAPLTDSEQTRLRELVFETVDSNVATYERNDAPGLAGFYVDGPDFVAAGDGRFATNFDSVAARRSQLWADQDHHRYLALDWSDKKVTVLGPDIATLNARYTEEVQFRSGRVGMNRGTWHVVFVRRPQGWRILHEVGVHCNAANTATCEPPKVID